MVQLTTSNKCHASSNRCLTSSNKMLKVTLHTEVKRIRSNLVPTVFCLITLALYSSDSGFSCLTNILRLF